MRNLLWLAILVALVASPQVLLAHSRGYAKVLAYFESKKRVRAGSFTVTDEHGQPVAAAQVLIGTAQDTPFQGNFVSADGQGQVAIPAAWVDPQTVTLDAPGFIRTTYSAVSPQNLVRLVLSPAKMATPTMVSGQATQFGQIPHDGYAYFALVTPTFSRADLFDFDPNSVVSPIEEQVASVFGKQVKVPSNLSIPNQDQSYIVPIHLDKPQFRMPVIQAGRRSFVATRGRFVFSTVVKEILNKKKVYDVVNEFEFMGAGLRDVNVGDQPVSQDVPVNEIAFANQITLRRPANIAATAMVFAVALPMTSDGSYMPSDLKRLVANADTAMKVTSSTAGGLTLAILKRQDPTLLSNSKRTVSQVMKDFELSLTMKPLDDKNDFQFLPLIDPPKVSANQVTAIPPTSPSSQIQPLGTYLALTELGEVKDGTTTYPIQHKRWQFFAVDWQPTQVIPQWPGDAPASGDSRWDIYYLGSNQNVVAPSLGPQMFQQATHAVRNSTKQ